MKKMMGGMMLTCNRATALVEKKIDLGLTRMERLKLIFHTSMCSGCRNYQKQSVLINKVLKSRATKLKNDMQYYIIPQLKSNILRKFEN